MFVHTSRIKGLSGELTAEKIEKRKNKARENSTFKLLTSAEQANVFGLIEKGTGTLEAINEMREKSVNFANPITEEYLFQFLTPVERTVWERHEDINTWRDSRYANTPRHVSFIRKHLNERYTIPELAESGIITKQDAKQILDSGKAQEFVVDVFPEIQKKLIEQSQAGSGSSQAGVLLSGNVFGIPLWGWLAALGIIGFVVLQDKPIESKKK